MDNRKATNCQQVTIRAKWIEGNSLVSGYYAVTGSCKGGGLNAVAIITEITKDVRQKLNRKAAV